MKRGIKPKKMDFLGSYSVCVDSKRDIQEIIGNVCGKEHARFRDEVCLAQNNSIKLYVLIENEEGITYIEDLFHWANPRLKIYVPDKTKQPIFYRENGMPIYPKKQKYPFATKGDTLAKALLTMEKKYGVTFCFCKPSESGSEIIRLLTESEEK